MIKYFLFDCFQVFFAGIMDIWVHETFPKEKADEIDATLMKDVDYGKMSYDAFCEAMGKLTGQSTQAIKDEYHRRTKPNPQMVAFEKEFSKNHHTYMLSNASSVHFHDILNSDPEFKKCFEKIYVSAEIGQAKPTPEFYQYVLDDLGVSADECVMVDDRQVNLDGAASLGIHTLLFKNYADFIEKLGEIAELN